MSNTPRSNYRAKLGDAAAAGMLLVCRCELCRRSRVYVATDLAAVFSPEMFLEDLFGGRCPKCGPGGFWRAWERYAWDSDVGMLMVRRPAGVRRIQLWRDELYSAPEKPKE